MKNVADIYPLTPVQSGMLFHTLAQERGGVYVNQFTCTLRGDLQPAVLRKAWQQSVERYPVLRTAVLWEGLDEPLQVVREQVTLPWQQIDWQEFSAAEQETRLVEFLQRDRTQGFDLAQAPLLRLTLIQLTDDTYQFIWSNHHLLYDGWSLLLIWQDVLTYYAALAQASTPEILPALAPVRPFRDYVAWQRQQDVTAAEDFWRNQLQTVSAPTPLPAARSTSRFLTLESVEQPYRQQSRRLSVKLFSQLTALARQHRLTMNTLVQGAWALLLSHYSDGDYQGESGSNLSSVDHRTQVTYGSVVSGRPAGLSGVETMVGLFINTLPVTVHIDPEQFLMPWLQARQQQLLHLRQYEATPLNEIQRWSELPQGASLFESIVAFENLTATPAPNLSFEVTDLKYLEQSNYPLALLVFPEEGLDLRLLYDVSRFEDGAIAQLLTHLEQLLAAFVLQPQTKLGDLPRLTPAEQQKLSTWAQADYPQGLCIHQLIEAQVAKTPEVTAVTFGDESLTYAELNQRANQLAHALRSRGVTAGDRVALCLHRSLDMIVAILAVLKSGGTYVPLDPTYPESRLDYCLQDTAPQLLITQRSVRLPNSSVPCLYIDEENFSSQATNNLDNLAQPEDLAYIIYTSGSTGQPKGVMVSHRNLVHSTTARFDVYAESVGRFLLLSSIAFDSSVAGVFWTLCQGGTLVLSPQRIEQDLQQLATLISQQQITHTLCVPTLYNLLLEGADLQQLATLKAVIVAGEACSRTLAQEHYFKLPTTQLYNEYGPTEATVWCTAYHVPAVLPTGPISIGTAIPNTQIYLLNGARQPVPIGAVGEIYIGGEGITGGYLNKPEKTASAYVEECSFPNETSKRSAVTPRQRLYKTGDLGRYRVDGNLEWLGRCDRQVKIRGYRIELGEIEEILREQPGVQEAVVVAYPQAKTREKAQAKTQAKTQETWPSAVSEDSNLDALAAALATLPLEQSDALLASVEEGY